MALLRRQGKLQAILREAGGNEQHSVYTVQLE
jgi:hypothetical protein